MKRKLFILALSLVFIISIFTVSAFADESGESVPVCEHTERTPVEEQPATCTAVGVAAHSVCTSCGARFDSESGNAVTDAELEIPMLAHSYTAKTEEEKYVKSAGSCTEYPVYWYACEACGASAGDDENATDKFYESEALGHTFSDKWTSLDGEHWRACTQTGCNAKTDVGAHTFETAYGFKTADGHAHVCTICADHDELTAHVTEEGAEPTETDPVCCLDCGYKVMPPVNHKTHTPAEEWIINDVAHWHECTLCEGQQIDYRIHIDKDKDGLCDSCAHPVTPDPETKPIEDILLAFTGNLTKQQVIYIAIGAAVIIILAIIINIASISRKRRKW